MSTDLNPDVDRWTPTTTSTLIAAVVALGTVAALLLQVRLVLAPALVGSAGAVCFALSLWLVGRDRYETLAALLTSLLTVPIGVGVVIGTLGTVLLLVGAFFPVDSTSLLSIRSLLLVARVGLVAGCVFAVLGVALGLRNVADSESLASHYWLTVKTSIVPGVVGGVMLAGAVLSNPRTRPAQGDIVGSALSTLVDLLLSPTPFRTHLTTFFLLVTVAAVGVRAAVGALPVAELLADSGAGETRERRVARARAALGWLAAASTVGSLLALTVELSVPPFELRQMLGLDVYGLLVAVSTAGLLRLLLVGLVVLSVPTVGVVAVLRRVAQGSVTGFARRAGPVVGGLLVTVGAIGFARPILGGILSWIVSKLPPALAGPFREVSTATVRFYGAPAIVVVLTALLIVVTAFVVLVFRLALFAGYLTEETAGYSLAAGGLFAAAAFAGTVSSNRLLVFGALVASLLVWDMGRYGTTLGREIGRHASTRNAELVHAGGTLAVGVVGVGVAVAVGSLFEAESLSASPTALAALVGVLAGIVLLVAALR